MIVTFDGLISADSAGLVIVGSYNWGQNVERDVPAHSVKGDGQCICPVRGRRGGICDGVPADCCRASGCGYGVGGKAIVVGDLKGFLLRDVDRAWACQVDRGKFQITRQAR